MSETIDPLLVVARDWVGLLHQLLCGKAASETAAHATTEAPVFSEAETRLQLVSDVDAHAALVSLRTLGARRDEDQVLGAALRALALSDALAEAGGGAVYALHGDGQTMAGPCVRAQASSELAVVRAVFAPGWLQSALAPLPRVEGTWTVIPRLPTEATRESGVFVPPHDEHGALMDVRLLCPRGVSYRARLVLGETAALSGLRMAPPPPQPRVELPAAIDIQDAKPFSGTVRFAPSGAVAPTGTRVEWVSKGERHGLRIWAPDSAANNDEDATLVIRRSELPPTVRRDQSPE